MNLSTKLLEQTPGDLLKDPKLLCIKPDEMQTRFLEGLNSAEPILLENGKTSVPESVGVSHL